MTLYTDNDITEAYLAGKNGKPLPKPDGVKLSQVTKLQGVEYEGLYFIENKEGNNAV
jgi:hypothetical protein